MKAFRTNEAGERAPRRTRSTGIRRRWSGIVGLFVLVSLLGVMATIAVSTLSLEAGNARDDIEERLSELTGLDVTVEGMSGFTLLPRTQLSLTDVTIGAADGAEGPEAMLRVDAIVADLDLWSALLGKTKIERLSVVRPELLSSPLALRPSTGAGDVEARTGVFSASGGKQARLQTAAGTDTMRDGYLYGSQLFGAFLSRFGDLEALDIRDGVFRLGPAGGPLGISNANVRLSWPSKTSAARLTGSYVWNGQPTDIDLRLASPLGFLDGGPSGISLDMSSPPLSVAFDGEGATSGAGRFSGTLKVATPSLARSIRWLGDPRAVLPDIGAISIEATLDGTGRSLALRNATVSLDGFSGEGAVEMLMPVGGKPALGGTLAFERLDLTGFAEAVAPLPKTPFDLQRRISIDFVDQLDLDLRLSAGSGGIGTLPIEDLAATIKFKNGVATIDIGDVSVLGGRGQARLSIDSRAALPRAKGFAGISGIDSARLFPAIGISAIGLSGRSDISADIDAPVTNWADLLQRNRMRLDVNAQRGTLSGFDPQVFLSEGTKPFALATEPTQIPFRTLKATLSTSGTMIDIDEVTLTGTAGAFEAAGTLSTATNRIDVAGSYTPEVANASAAASSSAGSRSIGFRMEGEWPRPTVTSGPPAAPI